PQVFTYDVPDVDGLRRTRSSSPHKSFDVLMPDTLACWGGRDAQVPAPDSCALCHAAKDSVGDRQRKGKTHDKWYHAARESRCRISLLTVVRPELFATSASHPNRCSPLECGTYEAAEQSPRAGAALASLSH